jgi:1-acyl-sn-glycerol-3-phosphate acyltransferase
MSQNQSRSADRGMHFRHALQREIGRIFAPLWVPLAVAWLRVLYGYRIERIGEIRREFARIRAEAPGPLVICANHLTMIDSFLVAWALMPTWRYVVDFGQMPWNTPERTNFASNFFNRALAYLAKCIPITRGGRRDEVAGVLDRVVHLTSRGELALLFPEGGRSRVGRIDVGKAAWGVGRVVGALPDCRVLCVYLRGAAQENWSRLPAKGDSMYVDIASIEPKSDARGVRRSLDFSRQILGQLAQMETKYFAGRQ